MAASEETFLTKLLPYLACGVIGMAGGGGGSLLFQSNNTISAADMSSVETRVQILEEKVQQYGALARRHREDPELHYNLRTRITALEKFNTEIREDLKAIKNAVSGLCAANPKCRR